MGLRVVGRACRQWAALCGLMGCLLCAPAGAADRPGSPLRDSERPAASPPQAVKQAVEQALDFDIPALPLGDALKRYAAVTRQPALFRSELLADLTSTAVRGLYSPDAALRLMLDGTGLVAEKVRTASGVALSLKAGDAPAATPRAAGLGSLAGYPGLVQAQVLDALCGNARTRPGAYRSLLRFEVDAAGQLRRPRLLGSTGDAERDASMLEILRQVRLPHPPPAHMPQPLTLLVLPTESRDATRCRGAMGNADSAGP